MVLYEDTRQKVGMHKNIHAYCRASGIKIIRQALNVGDYQVAGKGDISIDTKQNVLELAGNVFQDHERFRSECLRAKECGIKLIILTEEALPGGRLSNWKPPVRWDGQPVARFNPTTLRKAMITMQEEYGVRFRFCDARSTGRIMIEYLKGERY